jgi:hypothetical protein
MIDFKSLSAETVLMMLAQIHQANCKKLDCTECNIYFNLESANVIKVGA